MPPPPMTTTGTPAPPGAAAPSFGEAPASATVDAISPSGRRWLLTTRAATVGELMQRVEYLDRWLSDHAWSTKAAAPSMAGQGNGQAQGETPTCPTHGQAMKQGRRGWYCPVKIADDDGTGRPAYCRQTVK